MEGFIIEVKINKEIQRYQESILFGLSLRQMVFALLAIGVAVGAYFGLKPLIGAAEVGWVCILAAFPFTMCGFFTYNGMPAERFLLAVIRSEIDKRIVVVEAIERIYNDKTTEELHTLHPLVLNSRWLFDAQYDSPMFVSNSTLTTVVKSLFKDTDYDLDVIENLRRRPDIICLKQYSLKAVCTDRIDTAAGEIMKPDQILIVEVKRGGFEITSEEVAQVEHYVRQIRKSAILHSSATIDAYVVGAKLGDIDTEKKTNSGRIHAVTYGHLVVTASQKLFNLRQRLQEHYATLGQKSIVEQALKETKQLKMYN